MKLRFYIFILFLFPNISAFSQTDHRIKNLKQIEISGNHAQEI